MDYQMQVIAKPKEGVSILLTRSGKGTTPFIVGEGSDNYVCGSCKTVLCEGVNRGQIIGVVLMCPNCGNYNLLKGT
jgi:hypothetical protein